MRKFILNYFELKKNVKYEIAVVKSTNNVFSRSVVMGGTIAKGLSWSMIKRQGREYKFILDILRHFQFVFHKRVMGKSDVLHHLKCFLFVCTSMSLVVFFVCWF